MARPSTLNDRLITTSDTAGVRVVLSEDGLAKLAADMKAGNTANLERVRLHLDAGQLKQLLALSRNNDDAPRRRRGRPPGQDSSASPVAIARSYEHLSQAELGARLGKGDSAVRNVEARGFDVTLRTLAEYIAGIGGAVDILITHADGTEARIPVPTTKPKPQRIPTSPTLRLALRGPNNSVLSRGNDQDVHLKTV
jgi:hypothetical protein